MNPFSREIIVEMMDTCAVLISSDWDIGEKKIPIQLVIIPREHPMMRQHFSNTETCSFV